MCKNGEKMEKVSIIVPVFNVEQYLSKCLDSLINQTLHEIEIICVDDCSTDNTDEIVSKYDDDRIIYLKNKKNSGAAVSRNKALKNAKGKWIAFLDSDDLWYPTKLEEQIKYMKKNKYLSFLVKI